MFMSAGEKILQIKKSWGDFHLLSNKHKDRGRICFQEDDLCWEKKQTQSRIIYGSCSTLPEVLVQPRSWQLLWMPPVTGAMQDVQGYRAGARKRSQQENFRQFIRTPTYFSLKTARKADFSPKIKGLLNISLLFCYLCWPPFALGEPPIHNPQ